MTLQNNDMIIGVFSSKEEAGAAIDELNDAQYQAKDISVVTQSKEDAEVLVDQGGSSVTEGAVSGATTGGVIGGIAGLLIGIGAIAVPGIGALLIGGPLAAALGLTGAAATTISGAATGALAGGLLGALVGLGVPEEDARIYEDRIKEGGILIAVPVRSGNASEVRTILEDNGADRVRSFAMDETRTSRAQL
jgi:uncharacterized membrane protein